MPLPNRWVVLVALGIASAWLVPNHSPPWVSFHADAVAAAIWVALASWIFWRTRAEPSWHVLTLALLGLGTVPWLQYAIGLTPLFGVAWISSLYLFGLALSVRLGETWQSIAPNQALDTIFFAVVVGGVASVALQFQQWWGTETWGMWTIANSGARRFYANMAQPNQLATLQLLGVLGVAWMMNRRIIGAVIAFLLCILLLIGVAITESRTAWLNVVGLCFGAILFRRHFRSPHFLAYVFLLASIYACFVLVLPYIYSAFGPFSGIAAEVGPRNLGDPTRFDAWRRLFWASLDSLWWGYGWGGIFKANFVVAAESAGKPGLFSSSHNLLLDIVLWNGYPLGLMLIGAGFVWYCRRIKLVSSFEHVLALGFITVLLVHALLELPLQYAFYLLPFGVMAGSLQASQGHGFYLPISRRVHLLVCLGLVLAYITTIQDYIRIESEFYALRFENARIISKFPPAQVRVSVLNQFPQYFDLVRRSPGLSMSDADLRNLEDVTNALPSARGMLRLAQSLALNGQSERAQHWLIVLCKTMPDPNCAEAHQSWVSDPIYARVAWPQVPD